jgi:putative ABC transport system permease protein
MLKNYFKTAWRNLGKSKMHSFINVAGLSIGMAVAIIIGLWIYDEVSFNKNFQRYNRIAQVVQNVTNNGEVQTWMSVPYPLADELRKNYGSDFKHIAMAVNWRDHLLAFDNKILKETGGYFEKEMPEMFNLPMLRGAASLKDPSSILLSASAAKAYFGNEDPLNKLMKIDDMPVVKVTGVYEDFPRNSSFANLNFIAPWDFVYHNDNGMKTIEDPWRPNFATLYVELTDNADISAVSAKIKDAKLKKVNPQ